MRDKAPLSNCSALPSSEMTGHCGILGPRVAPGLDNLMPLACEHPWSQLLCGHSREGQGGAQPGEPPKGPSPQHCPQGLRAEHLILQEKRVVSRNWARSTLGPGAADEMPEDEEVGDLADTFCLGERVELAVTMENKAEVSRLVWAAQGPGVQPLLPQLCHIAHTHLP